MKPDEELLQDDDLLPEMPPPRPVNRKRLSSLLVILASILPILILYSGNTENIGRFEVLLLMLILTAIGFAAYLIMRRILGQRLPAAHFAVVFMVLSMNFSLLRSGLARIMPASGAVWAALAVYLAALAAVCFLAASKRNAAFWESTGKILGIVLALLTLYNLVLVMPTVIAWTKVGLTRIISPKGQAPLTNVEESYAYDAAPGGGNLYWIILDECTDEAMMEKYFDYDASGFTGFLRETGFSVSSESYSNSNNSKLCAVDGNTLSYFSSEVARTRDEGHEMPATEISIARRDGILLPTLQELGFQLYQCSSHMSHFSMLRQLGDKSFREYLFTSTTVDGLSVVDVVKQMSVLSAFSEFSSGEKESRSDRMFNESYRYRVQRVYDYYSDPANLCFQNKTAMFTYILCPHTPFIFDADGNTVPSDHRRDWHDTKYYADQYEYTTSQARMMIENILFVDPSAVIILQGDHGCRGGYFVGEGLEIELQDQRRIMNAVYFGGEEIDIEGLSAVNTLRLVMTKLGADFPPLPDEGVEPFYYEDQIA